MTRLKQGSSAAERRTHDPEVVGASPAPATPADAPSASADENTQAGDRERRRDVLPDGSRMLTSIPSGGHAGFPARLRTQAPDPIASETRLSPAERRRIILDAYARGASQATAGELAGVAPMTARKVLLDAGVTLRRSSNRRLPPVERIQALRAQGLTLKEIGERYGVTQVAVWLQLQRVAA